MINQEKWIPFTAKKPEPSKMNRHRSEKVWICFEDGTAQKMSVWGGNIPVKEILATHWQPITKENKKLKKEYE